VTLVESCFASEGLSAEVDLGKTAEPAESALFGERGARAIISVASASLARVQQTARQCSVSVSQIGRVTRGEFRIQFNGAAVIQGQLESFQRVWSRSLAHSVESAS